MKFKVTRTWFEVEADAVEEAVAKTMPENVELRAANLQQLTVERVDDSMDLALVTLSVGDAALLELKPFNVVEVEYVTGVERIRIEYVARLHGGHGWCWGYELDDDGVPNQRLQLAYQLPSGAELPARSNRIVNRPTGVARDELLRAVLRLKENSNWPHIVGKVEP